MEAPVHPVHTRAQPSTSSIQTIRYEDSKEGVPPRKITSDTPPRSFPSTFPRRAPYETTSILSEDVKRDSGIAPSVSTSDGTSPTQLSQPSIAGAAREPALPTIVVQQDDETFDDRNGRSPPRTRSKEHLSRQTRSVSPPRVLRTMSSFRGIDTTIPTLMSTDDINLADLASDKISFSKRGSLIFGGKNMQDLIAAQGPGYQPRTDGITSPLPAEEPKAYLPQQESAENSPSSQQSPSPITPNGQPPRQGLVSGRRKPSMQMLQAAVHGGRVLSAEEVTFSRKVRSMYDHGDERGADWTSIDAIVSSRNTPEIYGPGANSSTPELGNGELHVNRARRAPSMQSSRTSRSTTHRSSYYSRESNELAGGIEDWGDVDSRDVDRYGFIHQGRAASRAASRQSDQPSSLQNAGPGMAGIQRVATSLRVEADHGRRGHRTLSRGPSTIRSSRSVPPKSRGRDSFKRGPGSIHSTHSTASRAPSVFRAKSRRVLAEASDMLTLPPHLAAIEEDEDVGKSASYLKQREWKREEKWQNMARPVRHRTDGKGGGMRFTFDTNDPKLIERTWKGIPDRWRATAWHSFLTTSARKRNTPATDEELIGQFHKLQEMNSADDVQIDVDVPRTVNLHIMFRRRYRGGQRLLFRVLHAVSLYFPDVGYVQGMASLAATLLCYFDEEKAFVMIVRMWQLRGLEKLFQDGFAGLMDCLNQFEEEWLENGEVAQKLKELSITSTAYGTRWYLTLFNMSIPFPAQLRVWDVFMLLGDAATPETGKFGGADLDVLHCTSAALIDATREILLDSDFENAMKVLTSFMPIKDEDVLMRVAKTEYKMKKKRAPTSSQTAVVAKA